MSKLTKVTIGIYGVLFFLINALVNVSVYIDNGVPLFSDIANLITLITLVGVIKNWSLPLPLIFIGILAMVYALKDAHVFASLEYVTLGFYLIFGPMLLIHIYALVKRIKHGAQYQT